MKQSNSIRLTAPLAAAVVLVTGGVLATASQRATPQAEPVRSGFTAANATTSGLANAGRRNLEQLKQGADLVFHGDVIDIRYAMSADGGPGRESLPHTFVTYRILSVLKGVIPDSVITLRFIGGFDPTRELYLRASTVPQFDVGDSDILFVQGNGQSMCPLVQDYEGRLRVIDGRVYTEMGHEVTLGEYGALRIGKRFAFEQVRTTNIQGQIHEMDLGPEAVTGPSNAAFVEVVLHTIAGIPDQRRGQATAFVSVDASVPFSGPDFTPTGPPKDGAAVVTLTPAELEERASEPAPDRSIVRTKTQRGTSRPPAREKEGDKDG